jgi:metacaspase-1
MAAVSTTKKAFLVGINAYPGCPLNGCVNDVLLMYKIITEKFKFDKKNIKILTDAQATRVNILAGLKWLTTGVGANDTVFFHYSGHGSQVDVNDITSSSESDGFDEIICNVDLDWNNPIRDNDLGTFFQRLPMTTHTLVVLDCCHSGTGLREFSGPETSNSSKYLKNKFLAPPPSCILSNPTISIDDALNFVPAPITRDIRTQKRAVINNTVKDGGAILIAGCKDNQTSADYMAPNGNYQGALTFTLAKVLKEANWSLTYEKLEKELVAQLAKERFEQVPQLESVKEKKNLKFLGGC